jgi:hypothetical protein
MPEDAPLKVEAWPIEKVIAYARNPRTRNEGAIEKLAASISVAPGPSAARRRRGRAQHLPTPYRSAEPVRAAGHGLSAAHSVRTLWVMV